MKYIDTYYIQLELELEELIYQSENIPLFTTSLFDMIVSYVKISDALWLKTPKLLSYRGAVVV